MAVKADIGWGDELSTATPWRYTIFEAAAKPAIGLKDQRDREPWRSGGLCRDPVPRLSFPVGNADEKP